AGRRAVPCPLHGILTFEGDREAVCDNFAYSLTMMHPLGSRVAARGDRSCRWGTRETRYAPSPRRCPDRYALGAASPSHARASARVRAFSATLSRKLIR